MVEFIWNIKAQSEGERRGSVRGTAKPEARGSRCRRQFVTVLAATYRVWNIEE